MPADNAQIARTFDELADLLELAGEDPFKLRAYRNFAEAARELEEPLADVAARGALRDIDGVGPAIAEKIEQMLARGTFDALERARAAVPSTLRDLLKVPGFGPKTVRTVWQGAGVTTLEELVRACEEGKIAALPGLGAKKQSRAHLAATELLENAGTTLLVAATEIAAAIAPHLLAAGAREVVLSGESRRAHPLVSEVVLLARGITKARVLDALAPATPPFDFLTSADTDIVALGQGGTHAKVRAVESDADWMFELVVSTGGEAHVRFLEQRAGGAAKLREICSRASRESDVYTALDLPFIPAELRDEGAPPAPLDLVDALSGVFHVHTQWSDGKASVVDMARAARDAGLAFVGISDHSQAASYANGLDAARLAAQKDAVVAARAEVPGVTILHGIEVDILADGALDLPDAVLAELDFVIASVHTRLDMPKDQMTARIVRAVSHPLVTILGHPTGRLLRARRGSTFDLQAVARAAAANDTYLEINGNGHRLDLSDAMVRTAAAHGARFAIDPDAHDAAAMQHTWLGLGVGRRAGLSRGQVLNAMGCEELLATLAARKMKAVARLG